MNESKRQELANALRERCASEAIAAYEDAKLRGLCAEGAWEIAIEAIRHADLADLLPVEPPRQTT